MTDDTIIPDEDFSGDDVLAAEYSLGLLEAEEMVQVARRARIDLEFGALVEQWQDHFSALTNEVEPVAPPKNLFKKIASEAYPDSPKRIWHQLGVLPALLGAGAAALVLILALQFGVVNPPEPTVATYAARIAAEDDSLVVQAAYVNDTGTLFVERQAGSGVAERSHELWLIAGDDAPLSLGVLAADGSLDEITIPAALRDRLEGATLAITDEPLGGSPTGVATGAILAAGLITVL
ncbi:anti-sigma factor [Octadecabacter sp. 1_MG-2023]|uniref:anti-sigma factor n=1 Tax=unclassified Octadecabacter TaxID=196158 RepID=UPI001C0A1D3B|nr:MULTISPECIES: anti-sigma factor [unclassified Octadecabacter]MBU2992954.1 anti-sigma factor [Octadecabacter sp. B2R22]MDO6733595.1 anti-sigma factor [Octadecabacter sp. 1_MG-2023]